MAQIGWIRIGRLAPWLASVAALACAAPAATRGGGEKEAELPPEELDLVAPESETDTGYLSTLATELEGELVAELVLAADDEARRAIQDRWTRSRLVTEQIKFAKNQLHAERLHLNLTAGDPSDVQVEELEGQIRIRYRMRTETIVTFAALREAGIDDPASLRDREYAFRVPADPRNLFERVGERCARGHESGSLASFNYFSYFAPDAEGCDVPLVMGRFTVRSLLPAQATYPEYDRLVQDGRIDVVAFYGAAEYGSEVDEWDWGMREWRDFERGLQQRGFRRSGVADETTGKGTRWTRTRGGLEQVVDVVSPRDLAALRDDRDGLFQRMVRTHEIVLYNGHSFYGSLRVLDDPQVYAPGLYQILFMNSCWSYEYYTKQVFRHKATDDDPTGWALADVVNDTQAGWFHNMEEFSRILLTNLLAGAESGGREGNRRYHWQNIIDAMNRHALDAQRRWGTETHEIMGVSGVRTNRFDPDRTDPAPGPTPEPERWERRATHVASAHPYADDVDQSFDVEAPAGARQMRLVFSRIETEARYDFVEVHDGSGRLVARYDGTHQNVVTPPIEGSRARIRLVTDYSITAWGFELSAIEYR
ncbi:MAG: CUB domain-containing protein [Myxococcota bacterium]|nr:CUB domain-containing protein [Myxococcota bacterium]MDW8363162.1 CUB domain-containing protein [Myxococcales bacterium]